MHGISRLSLCLKRADKEKAAAHCLRGGPEINWFYLFLLNLPIVSFTVSTKANVSS